MEVHSLFLLSQNKDRTSNNGTQRISPEKDLETVLQKQVMGLFAVTVVGASHPPGQCHSHCYLPLPAPLELSPGFGRQRVEQTIREVILDESGTVWQT